MGIISNQQLRVVFDPQIFQLQKYGGISRTFVEVYKNLALEKEAYFQIVAPFHVNSYLKNLGHTNNYFVPYSTNRFSVNKTIQYFSYRKAQDIISRIQPSFIHETFYGENLPWHHNYKLITTIHDLVREYQGNHKDKLRRKRKAIERASAFICVSKTTMQKFVEFYKIDQSLVQVVYPGANHLNINENIASFATEEADFLLYVGQRDGYKNWINAIKAYAKSAYLRKNFKFVCYGGGQFTKQERQLLQDFGIAANVLHYSGSDVLLTALYFRAACLISTSLDEGFGLPLIEAMHLGCPIAVSNIDIYREVADTKASFFDPYDIDSIAFTIESQLSVLNIDRMKGRIAPDSQTKFTWEKSASELHKSYKNFLAL